VPTGTAQLAVSAASAPSTTAAANQRPFVYGATVADVSIGTGRSFDLARQAGLTHVLAVLDWTNVARDNDRFAWELGEANDLDNMLAAARASGRRLIIRLDRPRTWSGSLSGLDEARLERITYGIAVHARGVAAAYEFLNEPNLPSEWGGPPDPAGYVRLLRAAQRGLHAGDPSAAVLSAGLAPYTGGRNGAMEDVDFLRAMYAAGGQGSFDGVGVHAYGGDSPPFSDPSKCGLCFRRVELLRRVMTERGDERTPIWITEFGYLHTTDTSLGTYDWMKLAPPEQADYLTGAFAYAYRSWPWAAGIVVFNLDFATVPWNPVNSGAYWFSLVNPDRSARPAFDALRKMDKPGAA
jgi:hypothetical protein